MKTKLLFLSISLLISSLAIAQKDGLPKNFDMQVFFERSTTADWLCAYDMVAWHSTDLVRNEDPEDHEELGPEWFCYQDEFYQWHAFYGKLNQETEEYNVVFHYVIDTISGKILKAEKEVAQDLLNPLARVVSRGAHTLFNKGMLDVIRWNWYVRYNEAKEIEFYAFPAFQPDGKAPYGGELFLLFDPTGKKQKEEVLLMEEDIRYFMPDTAKTITLTYPEREMPTLGAVFYAQYYAKYFKFINIQTKNCISMYAEKMWAHIPKSRTEVFKMNQPPKEEGKTKKKSKRKKKKKS